MRDLKSIHTSTIYPPFSFRCHFFLIQLIVSGLLLLSSLLVYAILLLAHYSLHHNHQQIPSHHLNPTLAPLSFTHANDSGWRKSQYTLAGLTLNLWSKLCPRNLLCSPCQFALPLSKTTISQLFFTPPNSKCFSPSSFSVSGLVSHFSEKIHLIREHLQSSGTKSINFICTHTSDSVWTPQTPGKKIPLLVSWIPLCSYNFLFPFMLSAILSLMDHSQQPDTLLRKYQPPLKKKKNSLDFMLPLPVTLSFLSSFYQSSQVFFIWTVSTFLPLNLLNSVQ